MVLLVAAALYRWVDEPIDRLRHARLQARLRVRGAADCALAK
jgi:peptidoglycan/LPS O-acetylase OafA/YrhL